MEIVSNNQWRQFVYRTEVPDSVLENDFDHLSEETTDGFFKYKGMWFHLSDFLTFPAGVHLPWKGYHNLTAFSSVVVRTSDEDSEIYQVGMMLS